MQCELILTPSEMRPLTYNGCPCISTEMLANAYEVKPINIQKNFSSNKDRFIEGKHYYTISGNDLKELRLRLTESKSQISSKTRTLTLWTERGAARHAKMLSSDKAWELSILSLWTESSARKASSHTPKKEQRSL